MQNLIKSIRLTLTKGFIRIACVIIPLMIVRVIWNYCYDRLHAFIINLPLQTTLSKPVLVFILSLMLIVCFAVTGLISKAKYQKLESFIGKIPLLGVIYRFFINASKMVDPEGFKGVYFITLEDPNVCALGLKTSQDPIIINDVKMYPILILSAFGITSNLRWFPEDRLQKKSDWTVQQAMSYAVSGGLMPLPKK